MSKIDDFLSGNSPTSPQQSIDDFLGTKPKKKPEERSAGDTALDVGKSVAGSVLNALGSIPTAAGRLVREGGEMLVGLSIDEARTLAEAEGKPEKALDYYERSNKLNPVSKLGSVAEALGGWISDKGEQVRDSRSDAAKELARQSMPEGDITKPSTWTMGQSPSVEGAAHVLTDVVGSVAPQVATAIATRGRSATTQAAVGGTVGASQIGGAAIQEANEYLSGFTDDKLRQASPVFRELEAKGYSAEDARKIITREAENRAGSYAAPVGMAGGAATGAILGKTGERIAAGTKGIGAKAAVLGALGATEEGIQEVGEGVATRGGINDATGMDRSLTEGTFGEFVLGAAGGGGMGAGRGVMQGVSERMQQGQQEGGEPITPETGTPPANPLAQSRSPVTPQSGASQESAMVQSTEAEKALRTPVSLTALDRVNEIDGEISAIAERAQELTPENGYGPAFDQERAELTAKAQELAAERTGIAQTWPKAESGAPTSFSTEAGVRLDAQYAIMDAADLVTSHNESLRPNSVYPQELQPRDRSRSASEMQVSSIVQKLDPARLGLSADAATGAPIVGADGLVESGNARTIALKRVYQANGQKAEDYKGWLRENAGQFGLNPEAVDGMAKPVLVRVRSTPVNRAEFARQANASTVQRMSPSEQALSDSKRLANLEGLKPDDAGDFNTSYDFIRQFMGMLPITEQSDMVESDGRLSTFGYRRIQNAVLAKAYGDSPTLRRMTESMDDNLRNITKALVRVAPTIAGSRERMQAGTMYEADIAPDLLNAVEGLSALKEKGWSVADELGQGDLTGAKYSPEAAQLLALLSDNIRSPRRIAEFVQRYYEALEAAGDPSQASIFGDDGPAPARADLLKSARGNDNGNTAQDTQRRDPGEGARTDAQGGRQPENAPGNRGGDQGDGAARATAGGQEQAGTGQELGQAEPVTAKAEKAEPQQQAAEKEPEKKAITRTADRDFWAYAKEQGYAPVDVKIGTDLHKRLKSEFDALKAGKARMKEITGKKINEDWTEFSSKSETMGVPRAEMPQIKAEHRGALTQFLAARGVVHERDADVSAMELKPTQAEFSPGKVKQAQDFEGGDRSILVSADGFVLDGHHQWLAKLSQGLPIRVIRFNSPMADLLPMALEFPSAEVAKSPDIDRAKLEKDFRLFPTRVMNNLIVRNDATKLYKAAGVKGADAFDGLPMDDKAEAYVKFVEQGGKPVADLPQDYDAEVAGREREAEVRRLQADRVVPQANGKAFKTKTSAQQLQERFDLKGTHEIVEAEGGFVLRQLSPAAQEEIKRKAAGRENYTEAQAAVAAEMGIGTNADGEWDVTDAQFDELERRTAARLRGEGLTAPTPDEIREREAAKEKAEADKKAADAKAEREDAKARERAEVARRSEAAADTFELGQDAMTNLTGQQDVFGAVTQVDEAKPAKAARTPAKKAARAADERIEDVGAQLYANRRNFTGRGIKWDDVQTLNETLKIKEVTKAKVWPRPNYEQLVADGMPALLARMVKHVYDGISAGPTVRAGEITDEQLQRYIDTLTKVRDGLFDFVNDEKAVSEFASSVLALNGGARSMAGPVSIIDMMKTDVDAKAVSELLLRRVWPEEYAPERAMRPFSRGTKANGEVAIIGGNKALAALQFVRQDFAKWGADLTKGWPGKREAWEVQGYRVLGPDDYTLGVYEGVRGKSYFIRANAGRGQWGRNEAWAGGKFALVMDGGSFAQEFDSREAAVEAAREKVKRKPGAGQDVRGSKIDESERTGPARRKEGEDINSQRLMDTFGFRGVNFGREGWINQAERQAYLNQAFDGLLDLADILGMPPKAISLNGALGIAFGAQGKGKFAAHFVPGVNEINLTKTKGAGALAHEWGHALDHHFANQAGLSKDKEPFLSEHAYKGDTTNRMVFEGGRYVNQKGVPTFGTDIRPEIVQAFRAIYQTMEKRDASPEETQARTEAAKTAGRKRLDSWITAARRPIETSPAENKADLLAEFDQHAEKLREGDIGDGTERSGNQAYSSRVAAIRNLIKDATGRVWPADQTQGLQSNAFYVRNLLGKQDADAKHEPQKASTEYKSDSLAMDQEKGGKAYWSTPAEMFARAFELYVHDKLAQKDATNTFLTDAQQRAMTPVEIKDASSAMARASGAKRDLYLYPKGQERDALLGAFDKLVEAIETRETEQGVTLLSRAAASVSDRVDYEALKKMAFRIRSKNPGMPPVLVLQDPSQAPKGLREYIIRQDAWHDVEGAMHQGRLFLFASGLTDLTRAEHVLLEHEGAHFGLRAMLGDSLKTAMALVYANNAEVRRAAFELQKRGKLSNIEAVEEVIVDIPTSQLIKLKGWRKVTVMVRDWLQAHGYTNLADKITAWLDGSLTQQERADLFVAELVRGAREYIAGKRPRRRGVVVGDTRLSTTLAEDIERQEKWLQTEARTRGYKDVEDMLAKNYPLFEKLAAKWREKNPADGGVMLSRGTNGAMPSFDNASGNFNPDLDKYWIKQGQKEINGEGMSDAEYNTAVAEYANSWRIDELLEKMGWRRRGSSNVSASTYYQKDIELDEPNADGEDTLTYEVRVSDHDDRHPADYTIQKRFQVNFRSGTARWADVDVTPDMSTQDAIAALEDLVLNDQSAPVSGGAMLSRTADQTQTPAFKKWFAGSKVVDPKGQPLVVYHGTKADFDAFDNSKTGANDRGLWGRGHYFSASVDNANSYALRQGDGARVMPVYVSIKNPLILKTGGDLVTRLPDGTNSRELVGENLDGAKIKQLALDGGHDGVIQIRPNGQIGDLVAYRPEQIKSATGNNGEFDGTKQDIRLSTRKTATERANDILAQKAGSRAPLDTLAKGLTRITGIERMTGAIYDRAAYLLDRYTPETVKAGVMSDYGVPQAVIDQRTLLQGRQRVQLRKAVELVEKLSTLTREESRVAYEWMNMDGQDPKAYMSMMQGLPEESVKVLTDVQKMIDQLSKEAVRMGQLSAEAYEANKFAYLRRSYAKHILEQTAAEKAKRARVISVLGDQYKGRGLTESAPMAKIKATDWWKRKEAKGKGDTALKGEKFIRLERRAASGEGVTPLPGMQGKAQGKLLEVAYWPAGETLPSQYSEWSKAGTFEVRDVKGENVIFWRDFTKLERETMGEVDEARFAIAKTLHGMIHDVEVGRYLEWMAHGYAKKEGETIPGTVVEASERYRDTFKEGEWVRVPDSKISGTNVHKYGKLAGRYLPGPVWNDLRQVVNGQFKPFGDTYAQILSMWKTAKTALSPAVHMNNVMSNFVMADWHDVSAAHVSKSLRIILAASQRDGKGVLGNAGNQLAKGGMADREAAREILNRYTDSGGDVGSWVTNEIAKDQLEPLLAKLEQELAATGGQSAQAQVGVMSALQNALMLRFPSAWEAFKGSKPGKAIGTEANSLIDLYQSEDDVFRLAAWLKAKEDGATDIDAGKASRRPFLDYSINAPWIQAMRQSAWPFISFTYRAVPMLAETAGKKPHKLMKLMMLAGALNALGGMLAGGDDDEERKLLPEEKAGKIWGMVPKLIRMPWNDAHDSPVYLDVRRFIPVGDVFDVGAGQSALPILPGMQPGGPLVLFGEVMLNKSAFTGKPITLDTDTPLQKSTKVIDHLYKAFAPNLLGLPGTYATTGVSEAAQGKTDAFGREQSVAQAVASSFGVKLGSYPTDVLRRNLNAKAMAEIAEVDKNIAQLKRQRQTNRISQEDFQDAAQVEMQKKTKIMRELAEKVK